MFFSFSLRTSFPIGTSGLKLEVYNVPVLLLYIIARWGPLIDFGVYCGIYPSFFSCRISFLIKPPTRTLGVYCLGSYLVLSMTFPSYLWIMANYSAQTFEAKVMENNKRVYTVHSFVTPLPRRRLKGVQ